MRSKHNQNKLVRFITIPIRVLSKARDMYVRSLTDYAKGARYSNVSTGMPAGQFTALPKSFSVGPKRSYDNEDYKELVRAASVRSMGHANEAEMFLQQQKQLMRQQSAAVVVGSKKFPKSCSVGMGFMGRIDEERSCDSGEDNSVGSSNNSNRTELYSRSRTVAATSRATGF
ncbi:hypothetical protein ACOSP7_010498 [Xanthoceras sorbifolium]